MNVVILVFIFFPYENLFSYLYNYIFYQSNSVTVHFEPYIGSKNNLLFNNIVKCSNEVILAFYQGMRKATPGKKSLNHQMISKYIS